MLCRGRAGASQTATAFSTFVLLLMVRLGATLGYPLAAREMAE